MGEKLPLRCPARHRDECPQNTHANRMILENRKESIPVRGPNSRHDFRQRYRMKGRSRYHLTACACQSKNSWLRTAPWTGLLGKSVHQLTDGFRLGID